MTRAAVTMPVAALAFVAMLALAALAVANGLVGNDTVRLWAGASIAGDGEVSIGRIIAGYPTLPFLTTTLVAWLAPAGAPAPALVAAGLFALIAGLCFRGFLRAGLSYPATVLVTLPIVLHPALLRAVIAGPAEMFFAAFLLMLATALYDLRARSGTSEVMQVGLALMGLAFSHPVGAAFAFASVPFLAFALRPTLVANSAINVTIALVFPTAFVIGSFAYVSWVFPGDGWSFFAAPAQSLSLWTVAMARLFGNGVTGIPVIDASLTMTLALIIGAPVAVATVALSFRRRPLVDPVVVFAAAAVAATAICVASGFFGDPTAILVAAPMLAAAVVMRAPLARERLGLVAILLALGWFGGCLGLALVDPITVSRLRAAIDHAPSERLDTIAAGGASAKRDGVLADTDNAPALVLGRGRARGLFGSQSEAFTLAMLSARIDTPFVAVPDPETTLGANDKLDRAFPTLYRDGLPDYRLVYQNNTWRLFARRQDAPVSPNNTFSVRSLIVNK